MKIKENIITTMDQPEAVQEDGDNCYQEEMLQAAVALVDMDSDLQSSGNSTSTSSPESDSDCENARGLVSRPIAQEKYRFRSATKRFNALKFEEQCFHFRHIQDLPIFYHPQVDKQNFRRKVEHFTLNEHRQKPFHSFNDQFNCGNYIFPCFLNF